jgi:hypothetical protein
MMNEINQGKCRVDVFIPDIKYIKNKKGAEGITKLNNKLSEMTAGFKISDIEKLKHTEMVPVLFRAKFLDACLSVLDNDATKIRAMGREHPKNSLIARHFLGYLINPIKIISHAPSYWKEHYTVGELEVLQMDENYVRFCIKNFKLSKLFCIHMVGYIEGLCDIAKVKNFSCKEIKCIHEGAEHCEYEIVMK